MISLSWTITFDALSNYQRNETLAIDLLYLKAEDSQAQAANSLAHFAGAKRVQVLPGDHFSLLKAPYVGALTRAIQKELQ